MQAIRTPALGQNVIVRWTNTGNQYQAPGIVTKVNVKTAHVTLTAEIRYQETHLFTGRVMYHLGTEIWVPIGTKATAGNGLFEAQESAA